MKEEQNHFIKNIEIKNFKCFENFSAEGFGRVNLIGGKNNVGKTAFMEACYLNLNSIKPNYLINALCYITMARDKHFLINALSDKKKVFGIYYAPTILVLKNFRENITYSIKTNLNNLFFKFKRTNFWFFNINTSIKINSYLKVLFLIKKGTVKTSIFLHSTRFNKVELKDYLNQLQNKKILNKYIKLLYEDTINLSDNGENIIMNNKSMKIDEFGDGIKSCIDIIISLLNQTNKYIFIDEIENGIHYTNLDKLWEIILTISKEQNVQVFATTHSKECIESYARVAKKLEDEEIGFIELGRNKKNELDAIVMDSEMFQRFIKLGNEVRGW